MNRVATRAVGSPANQLLPGDQNEKCQQAGRLAAKNEDRNRIVRCSYYVQSRRHFDPRSDRSESSNRWACGSELVGANREHGQNAHVHERRRAIWKQRCRFCQVDATAPPGGDRYGENRALVRQGPANAETRAGNYHGSKARNGIDAAMAETTTRKLM